MSEQDQELVDQFIRKEEYEVEFFGFLPSMKMDEIFESIDERMDVALEQVNKSLSKMLVKGISKEEIEGGMEKLGEETAKITNQVFQKAKVYALENVFRIPDSVELHRAAPGGEPPRAALPNEIEALLRELEVKRSQIVSQNYLKKELEREIKDAQRMLELQNTIMLHMPEDSSAEVTAMLRAAAATLTDAGEVQLDESLGHLDLAADSQQTDKGSSGLSHEMDKLR